MTALLLLIPLALSVLFVVPDMEPAPQPQIMAPAAETAPANDIGAMAYATAKDHLAAGRLSSASYYFEQAARNGHAAADSYQALALIQYRLDNVEQGDLFLGRAETLGSGRDWQEAVAREKAAAAERTKAHEPAAPPPLPAVKPPEVEKRVLAAAPVPAPIPVPVPALAEEAAIAPGGAMGVRGCAVLLSSVDGQGLRAGNVLRRAGAEVDCLASENGPRPKATIIWYGDLSEEAARKIAAALPGGAQLRHVVDLPNQLEIRLGASFVQAAGRQP